MPTSKLQRQVANYLHENTSYLIKENYRPDWLISDRGTRLELDFYIDEIKLAIEVQGLQHYVFVEHFHRTYENFQQRLRDDEYKRDYCHKHDISLIEVSTEYEIQDISDALKHKKAYHPSLPYKEFDGTSLSKKSIKFSKYSGKLYKWYKGYLTSTSPELIGKRARNAFHDFLQKTRNDKLFIPDKKFIDFLRVKFPDPKYADDLYELEGRTISAYMDSCQYLYQMYKGDVEFNKEISSSHLNKFLEISNLDESVVPNFEFLIFLESKFPEQKSNINILTKRWLKNNPMEFNLMSMYRINNQVPSV